MTTLRRHRPSGEIRSPFRGKSLNSRCFSWILRFLRFHFQLVTIPLPKVYEGPRLRYAPFSMPIHSEHTGYFLGRTHGKESIRRNVLIHLSGIAT